MDPDNRRRVLLIEGDAGQLRALARAFEDAGYDVQRAHDGQEGIARFHTQRPDLIVVQLFMRRRDGFDTLVSLNDLAPEAPIIAVSNEGGLGRQAYLALARQLGAAEALARPLDMDELLAAARRLLG